MKRDCRHLKFAPKNSRQQMLPGVLLHVIESPIPVNSSSDFCPRDKRSTHEVPHLALLILLHLFYGNLQNGSVLQRRVQPAHIERLSTARWVEGSTIQRQFPNRFSIAVHNFADVGYGSAKCPEK